MITTRLLTDPADLDAYIRCYHAVVDITTVTPDYLRRAQVRGLFRGGRLVGGYALNSAPPLRHFTLSFLGTVDRERFPPLGQVVEGACLWFAPSIGTAARALAYLCMIWDFLRSGKRYFLAGTYIEGIRRVQMLALPCRVLDVPFQDPRDGTPRVFSFFYGTRWTALTALPRWLGARLRKRASLKPSGVLAWLDRS